MEMRFDSEVEFRKFADRQRREYGRIQVRVIENLLVGKFFVHLSRWSKDFPGGGWDRSGYFVTESRDVAMSLLKLEREQPPPYNQGGSRGGPK